MLGITWSARDPPLRQSASSDAPQVVGNLIARITANRVFSHTLGQKAKNSARANPVRYAPLTGLAWGGSPLLAIVDAQLESLTWPIFGWLIVPPGASGWRKRTE